MASFFDDEIDGPEASRKQSFMKPSAEPAVAMGKVGRPSGSLSSAAPPAPIKMSPPQPELPADPGLSDELPPAPPQLEKLEMEKPELGVIDRKVAPVRGFLDRVAGGVGPRLPPIEPPILQAGDLGGGPSLPFPPAAGIRDLPPVLARGGPARLPPQMGRRPMLRRRTVSRTPPTY